MGDETSTVNARPRAKGNKPRTKADQVARLIWHEICANHLVAGDKLATEAEWAKQLGVSRLIVREAVARLRGLGVVESKPRVGLRVRDAGAFNAFEFQLGKIASTSIGLRELSELRLVVELGNVWALAKVINAEQVASLQEMVDLGRACTSLDEFVKMDRNLHLAMLACFDNSLLEELGQHIVRFFHELEVEGEARTTMKDRASAEHQEIVHALGEHDASSAAAVLEQHILRSPIYHGRPIGPRSGEEETH